MEVSMGRIRLTIKLCNKIIPKMNDDELIQVAEVLMEATKRMLTEAGEENND